MSTDDGVGEGEGDDVGGGEGEGVGVGEGERAVDQPEPSFDPRKVDRALVLLLKGRYHWLENGVLEVEGSELYTVTETACNCMDFAMGHECKHRMLYALLARERR